MRDYCLLSIVSPTATPTKEIPMIAKLTLALATCAFFTSQSASSAVAQVESPEPDSARPSTPATTLTPKQLESFSDLTGDAKRTVQHRLSTDPKLMPLAAAAADARASRRTTGKVMAIIGFTVLGVGDIAGTYIVLSTPGYPNVKTEDQGRMYLGLGVGLLSLAVGLALAIPGLVKMASLSEVEQRALDVYSPGWQDVSFRYLPPPQVLGKTLTAPIWSTTF